MSTIFKKGEHCGNQNFVGNAYINYLTKNDAVYDAKFYDVYFEAGARNNWHIHNGNGQILLCTQGVGYYQEWGQPARRLTKGDVVEIMPDVKHWHGAAPDSDFTHIGINTNISKGSYSWLEPVTDEQYKEAAKGK